MVRARVRASASLLAVLSVPVMLLAAPLPASAAGRHLCETYGNYCVGADNLNLYTAVVEKPKSSGGGRNIIDTPLGRLFYNEYPEYLLQFADDATKCVAAANNGYDVVIHPCNGGSGVIWALDVTNGNLRWVNVLNVLFLEGEDNATQYQIAYHGDGREAFYWT